MLSLCSVPYCSKSLQTSPPLSFFSRILTIRCGSTANSNCDEKQGQRSNYAGVRLQETVETTSRKLRLDSWISSRISGISRARVQSSIKSGLVSVNGKVIDKVSDTFRSTLWHFLIGIFVLGLLLGFSIKILVLEQVSHNVKAGDKVNCTISELQPLRAEPEDIPLDIVYEDEHVLVVNKPAHMVITSLINIG